MNQPMWTVCYNIVSRESLRWVGTGWEFFDNECDAQACFDRHVKNGNCPTKRPYYRARDRIHLGAAHTWAREYVDLSKPPEEAEGCVSVGGLLCEIKDKAMAHLAWDMVRVGTEIGVKHKRKDFGLKGTDPFTVIKHTEDELEEIRRAIWDLDNGGPEQNVLEETADAMACLVHLAVLRGYSQTALYEKMIEKLLLRFEYPERYAAYVQAHVKHIHSNGG